MRGVSVRFAANVGIILVGAVGTSNAGVKVGTLRGAIHSPVGANSPCPYQSLSVSDFGPSSKLRGCYLVFFIAEFDS